MAHLNIILFQPEIPQNTGNIGRTCVAVNAKLWLIQPLGFQLSEKQLRRAGLDYWQYLDVEVVDCWEDLRAAIPHFRPWKFTKNGNKDYTAVKYHEHESFVFGSESNGLPESILAQEVERNLRLPMRPQVRSLNLSTTVGIAIYEYQRQMTLHQHIRTTSSPIPPPAS